MKLANTPLTEAEFYRRLDQLVPGDRPAGNSPSQLETELYFERLSLRGLEEMHRYSVDERLYEHLEYRPFSTLDETRAYIEKLLQSMGSEIHGRTEMCWFVRRNVDHRLVGTARLVCLNYPRQSAEWGYGVDPDLWGTGYILQIQEMLKHYVFEVLRLNRLGGIAMAENERTISSLVAAGMKHEGTLREYYCKNGIYQDGWIYGMLAEDHFHQVGSVSNGMSKYAMSDVVAIVASILPGEDLNEESNIDNTPSWDSLNHMAIMVAISQKTGVSLAPIEVSRARSIKIIHSLLNNRV